MSAADVTAGSSRRPAGRLQTVIVIAVTAVVIGIVAVVIGQFSSDPTVSVDPAAAGSPIQVGAVPPNFTGQTYDGKTVSLADYAGKPLWLTIGGSWCRDCRVEAADVEAAYAANQGKGLQMLGVFINEPASDIQAYAQRVGFTFPIVVDQRLKINDLYRATGYPTHIFIGADGKIRQIRNGAMSREDIDAALAAILN